MNIYLAIRISHAVPVVLLLLGILTHLVIIWRLRNQSPEILAPKLQRIRYIGLPVFALLALSLPVSGWWLTHLAGQPLSQFWLLSSIILLPLVFIFGFLLQANLARWLQQLATQKEAGRTQQRFTFLWTLAIFVLLLLISALMGAKPI